MSLLAIDAGNTRIKWGLHDGHEWFLRGAFATADAGTPVAFSHLQPGQSIGHIIVSNVAGPEIANRIKDALYPRGAPIAFIVSQAQQCGVTSRYQAPKQLGCDRWAALVAAYATSRSAPRAQLVVMAGTALTVDALTAEGVFLGGLIVPGPQLMRHSLSRGTALLPAGEGDYQQRVYYESNA